MKISSRIFAKVVCATAFLTAVGASAHDKKVQEAVDKKVVAERTAAAKVAEKEGNVVVWVEGMTCSSCMNKVKKELSRLNEGKYKGKNVQFEVVLTEVKAKISDVKAPKLSAAEMTELKNDISEAVKKAGYTPTI